MPRTSSSTPSASLTSVSAGGPDRWSLVTTTPGWRSRSPSPTFWGTRSVQCWWVFAPRTGSSARTAGAGSHTWSRRTGRSRNSASRTAHSAAAWLWGEPSIPTVIVRVMSHTPRVGPSDSSVSRDGAAGVGATRPRTRPRVPSADPCGRIAGRHWSRRPADRLPAQPLPVVQVCPSGITANAAMPGRVPIARVAPAGTGPSVALGADRGRRGAPDVLRIQSGKETGSDSVRHSAGLWARALHRLQDAAVNATAHSVDPVDVARAAFRSVAAGHLDHFTELLHEDVVFDVVPVGLRRGRQAVRRYFEEVRLAMPDLVMTMEHAVEDDRYADRTHPAFPNHLRRRRTGPPDRPPALPRFSGRPCRDQGVQREDAADRPLAGASRASAHPRSVAPPRGVFAPCTRTGRQRIPVLGGRPADDRGALVVRSGPCPVGRACPPRSASGSAAAASRSRAACSG